MFFKLTMFCQGKALYSVCATGESNCCTEHTKFPLQKAVFEGNLHLLARQVDLVQDGILFTEKNQIDNCGNTALTLAV